MTLATGTALLSALAFVAPAHAADAYSQVTYVSKIRAEAEQGKALPPAPEPTARVTGLDKPL